MVEGLNIYGICSTCDNRPECRSFKNGFQINSPVWNDARICERLDTDYLNPLLDGLINPFDEL